RMGKRMLHAASLIYDGEPGTPVPPPTEIGRKAYNLTRLAAVVREMGPEVAVPRWIVVPVGAADRIDFAGRAWPTSPEAAAAYKAEIETCALPEEFRAALLGALERAGLRAARLAVRSSAVEEDGAAASFAGQFCTVLGVNPGEDGAPLCNALRKVWASALDPRVLAHRVRKLSNAECGMRNAEYRTERS